MNKPRKNRYKSNRGGTYAAMAILALILIVAGAYFFFAPRGKQVPPSPPAPSSPRSPLPPRPELLPQHSSAGPANRHESNVRENHPRLPPRKEEPVISRPAAGRLAIIIDDMGSSLQEAKNLTAIGVPLTFSIIPGLPRFREVARYAAANGVETMLHVPMQSKEWPRRRLESNGLLVSMPAEEIRSRMEGFLTELPGVRGVNNHMGSEFTEHEENMRPVIEVLKEKGIFFVDSVTSPRSVGGELSREMGVATGRRNVFLDNEQNDDYIRGQLSQAVRVAKKTGAAIAICHPHPATIRTLAAVLPGLQREGIALVPASALVR